MSDLFGNHIVGFPTRRLNLGIDDVPRHAQRIISRSKKESNAN